MLTRITHGEVGLTANEVCMSALSAKKNISNVRDSGSSDFKEQGSELKIPRLSSEVPIQIRLLHDRSRHRLLCAQTVGVLLSRLDALNRLFLRKFEAFRKMYPFEISRPQKLHPRCQWRNFSEKFYAN